MNAQAPAARHRPQSHHRQHPRHDLLQIQQQHKQRRPRSDCSAPRPQAQFQGESPLRVKQLSSSDETTSCPGHLPQEAASPLHQSSSAHQQQQPLQQQEPLAQAQKQDPLQQLQQGTPAPPPATASGNGRLAPGVADPVAAAGLALSGLDPTTLQHMAAWFAANAQAKQQTDISPRGGGSAEAAAGVPSLQQSQQAAWGSGPVLAQVQ